MVSKYRDILEPPPTPSSSPVPITSDQTSTTTNCHHITPNGASPLAITGKVCLIEKKLLYYILL